MCIINENIETENLIYKIENNLKWLSNPELTPKYIGEQFVNEGNKSYFEFCSINLENECMVIFDSGTQTLYRGDALIIDKKFSNGEYPIYISTIKLEKYGEFVSNIKIGIKETPAIRYERVRRLGNFFYHEIDKEQMCTGVLTYEGQIVIGYESGIVDYIEKYYSYTRDYIETDKFLGKLNSLFTEKPYNFIETNNYILPIIKTGLSEGLYFVFYGYDEENEISEIIIPTMNADIVEGIITEVEDPEKPLMHIKNLASEIYEKMVDNK